MLYKSFLCTFCIINLSACTTLDPSTFENRITCTVSKDTAFYVSWYKFIGVASKISDKDATGICNVETLKVVK